LIDVFPDLWNELDDSKNNYKCDKKDIPYRSNIIYWWVCKKCDWSWKTRVSNRYASVVSTNGNKTGCPMCAGKILTEDNKLSTVRPGIAEDWDYIKNKDITPDNTLYGSHRRVWWLCSKCLFSWRTSVEGRAKKKGGCPSCSNKAVSHTNNLNEMCPDVAKEWDYERNYPLKPTDLVFGSHIRCWWTCSLCGHHWNTILYSRTGNANAGAHWCRLPSSHENRDFGRTLFLP
jgi:hypothetical protein